MTNIHTIARATPIRHQAPIQSRLQIASARTETTVNLVQTLAGLACRIQLSPLRPKSLATLLSPVDAGGESGALRRRW